MILTTTHPSCGTKNTNIWCGDYLATPVGTAEWTSAELFIPVFLKNSLNAFSLFLHSVFVEPDSDFGSYVAFVMKPYWEGKHQCSLLCVTSLLPGFSFWSGNELLFSLFFFSPCFRSIYTDFLSPTKNNLFCIFLFFFFFLFLQCTIHLCSFWTIWSYFYSFYNFLILVFKNLLRALHSAITASHYALIPTCSLH